MPEKGVFDLLEAYQELPEELRAKVGLVFVGDGIARGQLESRAAAMGQGMVQVMGFAQREELAAYYALAEAFVFPTHSDPWGLVVNEALASSLPIICSESAGCAADLVADRWNGLIVPPGDIEKLASAMEELAGHPKMLMEMGNNSWERIQGYSPDICAQGTWQRKRLCTEIGKSCSEFSPKLLLPLSVVLGGLLIFYRVVAGGATGSSYLYLAGLIGLEFLVIVLWKYEERFLPVLFF